ncbi:MAG: SCO family protein, partial [Leptospiraceae bacterium]|nr:SCO family protein [Leptospiraceae bacterium]
MIYKKNKSAITAVIVCILACTSITCGKGNPPIDNSLSEFDTPIDGVLPWYSGKNMDPVWSKKPAKKDIRGLSELSLINQNGEKVTLPDIKGKIVALSFFFTNCHGICPMVIQNMKIAEAPYKSDENVVMLSLSVDPWHDTVEKLKNFYQKQKLKKSNWFLLTGSQEQIYRIARENFDADIQLNETKNMRDFLHSELVYLLDVE